MKFLILFKFCLIVIIDTCYVILKNDKCLKICKFTTQAGLKVYNDLYVNELTLTYLHNILIILKTPNFTI